MRQKYKHDNIPFKELENKVTLPNFQRRLVWSKKQKENFIKTLHNGYPFGSILIYKYKDNNEEEKFTLIDGLQRYTTILDFKNNPEKYINFDKFIDDLTNEKKEIQEISKSIEDELRRETEKVINEIISQDKLNDSLSLYKKINNVYKKLGIENDNGFLENIIKCQDKIKNHILEYLDIDNIIIPTIYFTGEENELADVFENLNKGGKKLTKYQVFAAQWSNKYLILSKESISENLLERVIERYARLTDQREIDIEGYDESELRKSRKINLSEFCYGLGELILEKMEIFWQTKNEDLANTIGYTTLAIVLDVDIRKLNEIIDYIEVFENKEFIEELIKAILEIYSDINNLYKNFLKYPGLGEKYETNNAKDYQLLSYFAVIWINKYNNLGKIDKEYKLTKKKDSKRNVSRIMENLKGQYLYDIFSGYWSGTGDSKLNSIIENGGSKYLNKISNTSLENMLYDWWENRQQLPSIRFDSNSKCLIVIQANYDRHNYDDSKRYELEHIIAKASLKDIYKTKLIAGGSLGNLMLLEETVNRSKKDNSIYDIKTEYDKLDSDKLSKLFYPTSGELTLIREELSDSSNDMKSLKRTICNRGKDIITNILKNMLKNNDIK